MDDKEGNGIGGLALPLPVIDEPEGERLPPGLPPVVDAHVHIFPDALFDAVRAWFDDHAWQVRYRLGAAEIVDFLHARGLAHLVLLQYAHRPGIAGELNRFMAGVCRGRPWVSGLATVFPGEEGAANLLAEAFAAGLAGVKLHAHVQCFTLDGAPLAEVCRACAEAGKPLLVHAGREPWSAHYPCDPYAICRAEHVERLLREYPDLDICVPHLGADEFDAYRRLLERHDNLWLDTTMALGDFFPFEGIPPLTELRADRLLYGTDFPNVPYAWDREIRRIAAMGLPRDRLEGLLFRNAAALFRIGDID